MEFMVGTIVKKKKERERRKKYKEKNYIIFEVWNNFISLVSVIQKGPKVSVLRNTIEFY